MRGSSLLTACYLTFPFLPGVLPEPTASQAEQQLYTVSGRALNDATRLPLPDVEIVLRPVDRGSETKAAASDASGRFSLERLAAGRYYLTAKRRGYSTFTYGSPMRVMSGRPLALGPGQLPRDLEVRLVPLGVIAGRAVDPEGGIVGGARQAWGRAGLDVLPYSRAGSSNAAPVCAAADFGVR